MDNVFEQMYEKHESCHIIEEDNGVQINLRPSEIKEALKGKLSESDIDNAYNTINQHNRLMDLKRDLYNGCQDCNCCNNKCLFHSIPCGSINAKIMVINKMPTQYEACRMHSMSDKNGTFLSLILQKMNVERDSIYMTDMIKCNAQLDEYSYNECLNHYLKQEIDIVSPSFILCNGMSVLKACIKAGVFTGLPSQVTYGNIYSADSFNVMAMYDLETVLQKSGDDYSKCKDELWHQILNAFKDAYK